MSRLGSFLLRDRLGSGAQGEVWSARRAHGGRVVAVKLLRVNKGLSEGHRAAFLGAARSIAALHHPAIVAVEDFGLVGEGDRVKAPVGTPWLAMELLEGGSLAEDPPEGWVELRGMLDVLLGALAHAHARDVVHRDLKPANVLRDDKGRLRLADFGMSLDLERASRDNPLAGGTPATMAPEQFSVSWRQQGPWTDLYALGVLGWWATSGSWPHQGSELASWRAAHHAGVQGSLAPRFGVPDGFEAWLRALMAAQPRDRPTDAAAARRSLRRLILEAQGSDLAPPAAVGVLDVPTLIEPGGGVLRRTTAPLSVEVPDLEGTWTEPLAAPARNLLSEEDATSVPARWQLRHRARTDHGLGLGLVSLRSPTLVGRSREQETLWSLLRAVAAEQRARAVLVRGIAGIGKSALCGWLYRRARELGVVLGMRTGGPGAPGLVSLLRRLWRVEGLSGARLEARLSRALADEGAEAPDTAASVARLLSPRCPPAELVALTLRAIARRRGSRPLLLWVDEAHCDAAGRLLARRVLDLGFPALVMLAIRDEAVPASLQPELQALAAHPAVETLRIGPLARRAREDLLGSVVSLSPELSASLGERSRGHPLFALELARDWARRGLLEAGPQGYRLVRDAPPLPRDLAQVWSLRLSSLVVNRAARVAFELAAVLGEPVDVARWGRACEEAGAPVPHELWAELVRQALVKPEGEESWRFSHSMLCEALVDECRRGLRLQSAHAACAEALAAEDEPDLAELLLHRAGARQDQAVIDGFPAAVQAVIYAGDRNRALGLCAATLEALDRVRVSAESVERVKVRYAQARIARISEDAAEGLALATEARELALAGGHTELAMNAGRVVVQCEIDLGHFDSAAALAGRLAGESGDALMLGYRAMALARLGQLEVAEAILGQLLEQTGFLAWFLRGAIALERCAPADAEAWLRGAIERAEGVGSPLNAASFRASLSQARRLQGDTAGAQRLAEQAVHALDAVGSPWARTALVQSALSALASGRPRAALAPAQRVLRETLERPQDLLRCEAAAALGWAGALLGEPDLVVEALLEPLPEVSLTRASLRDLVSAWQAAAHALCGDADDPTLRAEARAMAKSCIERLRAQRVQPTR